MMLCIIHTPVYLITLEKSCILDVLLRLWTFWPTWIRQHRNPPHLLLCTQSSPQPAASTCTDTLTSLDVPTSESTPASLQSPTHAASTDVVNCPVVRAAIPVQKHLVLFVKLSLSSLCHRRHKQPLTSCLSPYGKHAVALQLFADDLLRCSENVNDLHRRRPLSPTIVPNTDSPNHHQTKLKNVVRYGGQWLQCDRCNFWYHFACTGLHKMPNASAVYCRDRDIMPN